MFDLVSASRRLATLLASLPEPEVVALLSRVLDTLPVGVALYDASDDEFRVLYLNPAAEPVVASLQSPAGILRGVRDTGQHWHLPAFQGVPGQTWDLEMLPVADDDDAVGHLILVAHLVRGGVDEHEQVRIALELAVALGSTLEPHEVIKRLLERVVEGVHVDRATLSTFVGDEIQVEAAWESGGEPGWIGHRYSVDYLNSQPLIKEALATRQVVLGDQLNVEDAASELKEELGRVRRTAILPLVLSEQQMAMLVLSRRSDQPFTSGETASLQLTANVATAALRNARLFAEVEAARDRADRLSRQLRLGLDVSMDLALPLEPAVVVSRLLQRAIAAAGAERATLLRIEGQELVVEDSHAEVGPAVPIGTRLPLTADPAFAGALSNLRPYVSRQEAAITLDGVTHEPRHFIVVPLVLQGEVLAVLGVSRAGDHPFSDEDVAMLQQIGTVAAMRLRNVRLLKEATDAGRVRSEFLNLAAHELRTPYTVINGYLAMLHEGALGPAPSSWREAIRVLNLKSREMGTLIDRLLIAARLESGQITKSAGPLDLGHALRFAVARAQPRASLVGGAIDLELPEEPTIVESDAELVGPILDNLIDNALSYGGPKPQVGVRLTAGHGTVEVAVEDHGLGIPPELRDRIFDRFYRIDQHVFGAPSGTGLGLYIARRLAEEAGGSLSLDTAEGESGSRFVFRLPQH